MTHSVDRRLRPAALALAAAAAALLVSGCSTTAVKPPQPKAQYQEFTDATWKPETSIRAPYRTPELSKSTIDSLLEGVYAFYGTHPSFFDLEHQPNGTYTARETVLTPGERALTWSTGASTLYRNARAVVNTGTVTATPLADGRLLLQNSGEAPFNMAVQLRAFNISGKPIRHFLRNGNNQPDDLAWFIPAEALFPQGSVAYLATYWLGDDEIVRPSQSTFTGAHSLERLIGQFSRKIPYCLSYVNHQHAHPYGVVFDRVRGRSRREQGISEGTFKLVSVNRSSMFCEPAPSCGDEPRGQWRITRIQGNRVLELVPGPEVSGPDLGIQPVNDEAVDVGFAEVMRKTAKGDRVSVVPVRILRNNRPIADFRLKFNPTAAQAVSAVIDEAARAKTEHDAVHGAKNTLSRPVK